MNIRHSLLLSFVLLICVGGVPNAASANVSNENKVANFTLLTLDHDAFRLYEEKDVKGIVLFTYGIGCPIAQQQLPFLYKLREQYASRGFEFYLLVSGLDMDEDDLKKERDQFQISIPILIDKAQSVAKLLGITRTAETILIETQNFSVVYRGALNDGFDYGSKKDHITKEYLKNAIEAMLRNARVKLPYVEVKGCLLQQDNSHMEEISYANDIAPIYKKNCMSCHFEGGAAPWSMNSYEKVKAWSAMTKEVILTKRMPPRLLFSEAGTFQGNDKKGISPEDEHKLLTWIDQGAKKKDMEPDPIFKYNAQKVKESEDWPWGKPDLILTLKTPIDVPASGWFPWQFQYISDESLSKKDTWLKAVYFKPSNLRVVHHVSIWAVKRDYKNQIDPYKYIKKRSWKDNKIIQELIRTGKFDWNSDLGQLIKGNKETLLDDSRVGKLITDSLQWKHLRLASYTREKQTDPFPEHTGRFLPKGTTFAIIFHFKTIGVPVKVNAQIGLYFYKDPLITKTLQPLHAQFLQGDFFHIPANAKKKCTFYHVIEDDLTLYAISIHLHYRGRSHKITAYFPDGTRKVLLHEPNFQYDFNPWENFFKKPIQLPKGSVLESTAEFDNTKNNPFNPDYTHEQDFGFQLNQEMFWTSITYTKNENKN